jgi:hypothetical protein
MLSQLAFNYCLDCLEQQISDFSSLLVETQYDILMQTCVICQHAVKMQLHVDRITQMLTAAYHTYTGLTVLKFHAISI